MRHHASLCAAGLALLLLAAPVAAQMVPAIPDSTPRDSAIVAAAEREMSGGNVFRALVGGSLFYMRARGDFARHVDDGFGYTVSGSFAAADDGVLAIRAEWQDITYDWEWEGDSTARNVIRSFDVGPQLVLPSGAVRPYVSAAVGVAYTGTHGSRQCRSWCEYDEDGDLQPEGYSHLPRFTYSLARAAGVLVRLTNSTLRRPAVWLDLRVSQRHNGKTEYGIGGARESARGHTEYRVWHVGVSSGMR